MGSPLQFCQQIRSLAIFIEKLDAKLNFQADPYFNTYNPSSVDPIWKSLIKSAIGWQKSSTDAQEAIWQGIVKKYSENIMLDETQDGSVKIVATHVNPQRAADRQVNEIIKRSIVRVKRCERPSDLEVSGHSLRVGAAQDLLIKGFDLAAIMRAGGWSDPTTVSRYLQYSQHNIWS